MKRFISAIHWGTLAIGISFPIIFLYHIFSELLECYRNSGSSGVNNPLFIEDLGFAIYIQIPILFLISSAIIFLTVASRKLLDGNTSCGRRMPGYGSDAL
ncbi:hypothetical protein HT746_05790 [Burkholderia pyrrocinia]|uniref:hypothetical protein n=1 Tax=Burkholderia pyrrocinia TaxID=60550 RepID=UPI001575A66D|nr:hypothetical protein [Burkholderia pyrrocinia]NTX26655.1 hypothetical protein [Burkholderia pyrrocinia]